MEINLNVKAPELAAAIQSLADAIVAAGCIPVNVPARVVEDTTPTAELLPKIELPEAPVEEPAKPAKTQAAVVSLETVRAKLADLSRAGKQAQVKEIISKYNAKKLTEIPADKFAEVLADAESI